jgi:GT2 family glycosyltransferase
MNKVSVVIPNYNGENLLRTNLPFVIKAKENLENGIIEIIVVDDASVDNSVALLKKSFPEVKVIKHKINRGFSASVNTGVRSSKGEFIALLNSDVLPAEDFLVNVLPHFEDKNVFGVSLHEKGYGWAKGFFKDGMIEIGMGAETGSSHRSFYVSGGSGVFRRSQWVELSGMDEKTFSPYYWEDVDLSFRAAKKGYILLWEPEAKVSHEHKSTIGQLSKSSVGLVQERNRLLFIWKNILSANLIRKHVAAVFKRCFLHPGYVKVVFSALSRLRQVLKARAKEVKESKISDEAIFARS